MDYVPGWADLPRGEMTEEQRELARRRDRVKKYQSAKGEPLHILQWEKERARVKVTDFHDRGMSYRVMEEQTGYSRHVFGRLVTDSQKTLHRDTYDAVMGMRYEEPVASIGPRTGPRVASTASVRRIEALRTIGFSKVFISEYLGVQHQNLPCRERKYLFPAMEIKIREMYDKLAGTDPADYGIDQVTITRAVRRGKELHLAPPTCWDDDTIDDPAAFPEWTGQCGTTDGYYLHLKYDILTKGYGENAKTPPDGQRRTVLCEPCVTARKEDKVTPAKRSEFDWGLIKTLLKRGMTHREIADKVGCSKQTAQRVANKMKSDEGWQPPRDRRKAI